MDYPSYLPLFETGELAQRAETLTQELCACALCPRQCGVDRLSGEMGCCHAGHKARVASHNAHHGEEPPISGTRGSGTVFFAHCTMHCLFCQNFPISQLGHGRDMDDNELAACFLRLKKMGCHNLNLVTPTHYVPQFLCALVRACEQGFDLPIVYNTSGYERLETLRALEHVVDVYLPDIKYANPDRAREYSDAENYMDHNIPALREMWRQVGPLELDAAGLARRGMIVRHLLLPGSELESIDALDMIVREIPGPLHVSLMSQYFPAHRAHEHPLLRGRVDPTAYAQVVAHLEECDIEGWVQPMD